MVETRTSAAEVLVLLRLIASGVAEFEAFQAWEPDQCQYLACNGWQLTMAFRDHDLDHTVMVESPGGRTWHWGSQRYWGEDCRVLDPVDLLGAEERKALALLISQEPPQPFWHICPLMNGKKSADDPPKGRAKGGKTARRKHQTRA
jgi:hypothetical protein